MKFNTPPMTPANYTMLHTALQALIFSQKPNNSTLGNAYSEVYAMIDEIQVHMKAYHEGHRGNIVLEEDFVSAVHLYMHNRVDVLKSLTDKGPIEYKAIMECAETLEHAGTWLSNIWEHNEKDS